MGRAQVAAPVPMESNHQDMFLGRIKPEGCVL